MPSTSGWNLQGKDADGRVIFWSGQVEDNGRGPVEPGAHFYRSYQLDGAGNPINKRNAWQARSVLYVRLIPPGAADVAHYRVQIPKDAKGPITLHCEAELPQVLVVLHAVRVCRPAQTGAGCRRCSTRSQQPGILVRPRQHSAECLGRNQRRDSGPAHRHAAREAKASVGLGANELDPGGSKAGPRALERLGHRPAAARRSEGRRVRVPGKSPRPSPNMPTAG